MTAREWMAAFVIAIFALTSACAARGSLRDPQKSPPAKGAALEGIWTAGEPRIDVDRFTRTVEMFSADAFEGRAPGGAGEARTVAAVVQRFRAAGLQPVFPGGAWTQTVPLLLTRPAAPFVVGVDTPKEAVRLESAADLFLTATSAVARLEVHDAPLVFAGFGIVAPERNWDDYGNADVRGKIVIAFDRDPDKVAGTTGAFRGRTVVYADQFRHKFEEASRRGAAGLILIDPRGSVRNEWNPGQYTQPQPRYHLAEVATPAAGFYGNISFAAAERLFEACGIGLRQELERSIQPGHVVRDLTARASFTLHNQAEVVPSVNLAARLPGRSSRESVVLTAHWDHLGVGTPVKGDAIYNGAADNAIGMAAILAIADALAASPRSLRRSVIVLLPTAEERGRLGSEYFLAHRPAGAGKIVADINVDGIFPFGRMTDVGAIGWGLSDLDDDLEAETRAERRTVTPDAALEQGYYYRLDSFPFARVGIPSLHVGTGSAPVDPPLTARVKETLGNFYHQPFDEYRPDVWQVDGMIEDIRVIARVVARVANRPVPPSWRPGRSYREVGQAPPSSLPKER